MLRDPYNKLQSALKFTRDFGWFSYVIAKTFIVGNKLKKKWVAELAKPRNSIAVIVGGGPSYNKDLRDSLINNIGKFDLLATNFYCLGADSDKLEPKYYFVSDPHIVGYNKYEKDDEKIAKLNDYLNRKKPTVVYPDLKIWAGLKSEKKLPMCDREALFTKNSSPWYPRGYTSNTVFKAIAAALFLNYEEIYVLGFDYDYPRKIIVDENCKLALRNDHHYENSVRYMDHVFHSVAHALRWWADDYRHLTKLKSETVYNVTSVSMIDTFKKITPYDFCKKLSSK